MQVRKDKSEIVSLWNFRTSVNLAGIRKDVIAEFIVICNEGRPLMGKKTARELDVL